MNSLPTSCSRRFARWCEGLLLLAVAGALLAPPTARAQLYGKNNVLNAILADNTAVGYGVENMFYVGSGWAAYYEGWAPYGRAAQCWWSDNLWVQTYGRARVSWSVGTTATQGSFLTVYGGGSARTTASGYSGYLSGYMDYYSGGNSTEIVFTHRGGSDVGVISRMWLDTEPNFYQTPSDAYARDGYTVSMTAKAHSGSMSYEWYDKYNNYLGSGSTINFTANTTRAGWIRCRAYNTTLGSSYYRETSAYLFLITTPGIATQPTSVISAQGGSASFSVGISEGTYQATFQWYKNGNSMSGQNGSSLNLYNLQASDAATYKCLVSNSAGSVWSADATLTLATLPVITAQPVSITRNPGTSASFSVTATGLALSYQWYKNTTNTLAGATTATYTIPNVVLTDAGNYQVKVSNPAGFVWSSNAVLNTIIPPTIVQQPLSVVATQGYAAVMSVTATGSPPTYQWRRQVSAPTLPLYAWWRFDEGSGTSVADASGNGRTGTLSGVSWIAGTRSNALSFANAGVVNFGLNALPPPWTAAVWVRRHADRDTQALLADSTGGSFIKLEQFPGTHKVGLTQWGVGDYSFNYTAPLGQWVHLTLVGTASETRLYVNGQFTNALAQTISLPLRQIGAPPGDPLDADVDDFKVFPTALSAAEVATVFSDVSSGWADVAGAVTSNLVFAAAQVADAGIYGVVVSNLAGTAISSNAALTVLVPPTITNAPVGALLAAGASTNLSVVAGGTTPLGYQWQFKNASIAGATASSLALANLTLAQSGPYRVIVTNVAGAVTSAPAVVTVMSLPSIVTAPTSVFTNLGATVALRVTAATAGSPSYQWYFREQPLPDATNATLVLPNAQLAQMGWYRVRVSNPVGAVHSPRVWVVLGPLENHGVAWGDTSGGQTLLTPDWTNLVALAAGDNHSLGLRGDGSVLAVGANDAGESTVPPGLTRVVGLAAGSAHSVAVRENGTVVSWGNNDFGLTNTPVAWSNVVAVAAGAKHTAALSADGTPDVRNQRPDAPDYRWEVDAIPMAAVPARAIAAAAQFTVALNASGEAVVWGADLNGLDTPPAAATNLTAIAAGGAHIVALRADGQVVAWGDDEYGQSSVPAHLTNAVAVAAGGYHSQAILADGTVVAWGAGTGGKMDEWPHSAQSTVPLAVTDATTMAAGLFFGLAAVPTAPYFLEPLPARVGYTLGQTVTLTARAGGCLPLGYQWLKDGVPVPGATSPTLTLTNLGPYAGALYTVVVSNLAGTLTSSTLNLERDTPYDPLQITQHPQSVNALRAAAAVVLSVGVAGTGPIQLQWHKDGNPIPGATNDFYRAASALLTDSATYTVVVDNYWEALTSEEARVNILDAPDWPEHHTNMTLSAGQSLTLVADNAGSGPFTYQWFHNGQPIEGVNSNTLFIASLTWRDEGEYAVQISNPVGTILRNFVTLHVVSPPYLLTDLADVASPRGTNAELYVYAGGEPPLGYTWYRDGALLPDEFGTNLIVYGVAYSHTNLSWQVVVTNFMGSITSRVARLTIIEPPVILTQPVSVLAEPNTEARFNVACGGTEPLQYQWLLNGAPVAGGTAATLVIAAVTSGKQGLYEVEVANPAGTARSDAASLSASVAPVALGVSVNRTNVAPGSSFALTARVAGLGPFDFQWLFNGVALEGQTNLVLIITNTSPDAAGWYSFQVRNAYGDSTLGTDAGTEVRVVDLPYIESGPDDVLAILGRPATFRVTVRGTNRLSYQWLKESEPISGATASAYTIANPKAPDAGMYSVAVANSEGTTWSSLASLTFAKLPQVTMQPSNSVVQPGGSATFTVGAQSQFPVTYQWRQDGSDLPGETSAALSVNVPLRVVGWDHSYSVVISSEVGRVSSMPAVLMLQRTPDVLLKHSRLVTQTLHLLPGWNAIYLTVQPVSNRVEEVLADAPWSSVWMWRDRKNPVQFIEQMTEAVWNEPDWLVCFQTNRTESFQNNLFRLFVNQAYLIHLEGTEDAWVDITGEPSLDVKEWRADSYNLTGLPIETGREPTAADYFRHSPAHYNTATGQIQPIYRLAADGHWQLLENTERLSAETAYWFYVRGGSSYAGPVEISLGYGRGLLFGKDVDKLRLTMLNRTDSARRIWLAAHPLYAGGFPLMVREVTDQGNNFIELPAAYPVDVPARGRTELILGADRLRTPPEGFESVMLLGDDAGLCQQLPVLVEHVGAVTEATGQIRPNVIGLWVGQATWDGVSEVNSVTTITNRTRFTNDLGQVTNIISLSYTNTPSPMPTPVASGISQRLLLHVDTNNLTRLLSEVFQLYRPPVTTNAPDGYQVVARPGQTVLVTDRRRLADFQGARLRDNAMIGRRISSPTFAFEGLAATNNYLACSGDFGPGGVVTVTFGMSANHPLNPFKHKYHPDHDNLAPDFRTYQEEAYGIIREVTLVFDAATGGTSPAAGYDELKGEYREKIRGLHRNPIYASGRFVLRRFTPIGELNPAN